VKHRDVLLSAIERHGKEPQWRQLQEECAELIAAVNRFLRKREGSVDALIEEIADVEIMVQQARLLVGNDALIDAAVEKKIQRLRERLDSVKVH
jgi:NTP pyrophosphatase (non-canonical NTP hydrolase)